MKPHVVALILASGSGERIGAHIPKQFLKIAGRTLVEHTIAVFERSPLVDETIVVVNPDFRHLMEEILLRNHFAKVTAVVNGGKLRQESSAIGIAAVTTPGSRVLIHDAVRPFLSERIIADCVRALDTHAAVDVAVPATDTIIEVAENQTIAAIPPRRLIWRGQTPQAFRLEVIRAAHERARAEGFNGATDDCGLVLKYGLADILVVPGDEDNIKITYNGDIHLADKLFQLHSLAVPHQVDLAGLQHKVLVVFGASRGIGAAIARLAEDHGARVYGFSRANGVDVADAEQVAAAFAKIARKETAIHHVVNCAGLLRLGKLETRRIDDMAAEARVNYLGALHVLKLALPHLKQTPGSIALFASSSYTRGRELYAVYSSSKAAIVNLVQGVAQEAYHDGVRVNAMNPERTATPMRRENFGLENADELLTAAEVAAATLKTLLSDLTGQVVDIRKDGAGHGS
jgi:ribitol-5-phosphate 2-dehydrogenase (NADP+) / D-ribitol-5-phosphate cytidylyltransferase